MNIQLIVIVVLAAIFLIVSIKRVLFIMNDKNFDENSKWPGWMKNDAALWNKRNPNKQVNISSH